MDARKAKLRKEPQQTRALQRIEQILDAASEVFTEFGYDSSTTNEIARRADTSIGALYRFFPDKKAIFVALAQRYLEKVACLIKAEIVPNLSLEPSELACSCLELCDRFLASEPAFGAVFVYSDASPELREMDRQMKRNVSTLIASLVAKRNSSLSQSKCQLIGRVCVEVSGAYFRLCLSEPEMPHAQRRSAFQELLAAYLNNCVVNE